MHARDMTFGVEIETVAPDSAVQNDGRKVLLAVDPVRGRACVTATIHRQ